MPSRAPAFQWYSGDWLKDPGVRALSLAARGLWADMLNLMDQSETRGYLRHRTGAPVSTEQLARMVGSGLPEVRRCIAELERTGVFSRDQDGVIFSRRMVRDERKRALCAEAGKKGGNPVLMGTYEQLTIKGDPKGAPKPNPTPSSSSSASASKPLPPLASLAAPKGAADHTENGSPAAAVLDVEHTDDQAAVGAEADRSSHADVGVTERPKVRRRTPRSSEKTTWTRVPPTETLDVERRRFAVELGLDAEWQWAKFVDHEYRAPGHSDVGATWRNWCREAVRRGEAQGPRREPDPSPPRAATWQLRAQVTEAGRDAWHAAREALRAQLKREAWEIWIAPLVYVGDGEGVLYLRAPSQLFVDWLGANHAKSFGAALPGWRWSLGVGEVEFVGVG